MHPADGEDPVDADRVLAAGTDRPDVPLLTRSRSRSGPRLPARRHLLAGGAGIITLAVGISVGVLLAGPSAPVTAAAPAPTVTVIAEPESSPAPATATATATASGPVPGPARVEIPSLGIDSPLIDLFVAEDGTMGVPTTAEQIGWWEDGPIPGEPGASLIAAHVRLGGDDGVFLDLGTLEVGAEVAVDRVDGTVATYAVTSVEQFPKDEFPDERVYTFDGPTRLHLVTCGGSIDPDTGHYDDNVVVFADLVSDTRAPAGA